MNEAVLNQIIQEAVDKYKDKVLVKLLGKKGS